MSRIHYPIIIRGDVVDTWDPIRDMSAKNSRLRRGFYFFLRIRVLGVAKPAELSRVEFLNLNFKYMK